MPWANPREQPNGPISNHECPTGSYITHLTWREQDGYGLIDVKAECSDGLTHLRWTNNNDNEGHWNALMECPSGFSRIQANTQWGHGVVNTRTTCNYCSTSS